MNRLKNTLLFFSFAIIMQSCDGFKIPTTLFDTSDRKRYERQFSGNDSLLIQWKKGFSAAVNNRLKIEDGYSVAASAVGRKYSALGYSIDLKNGDELVIAISPMHLKEKIFVDVFDELSGVQSGKSGSIKNGIYTQVIENSSAHKIVIQPEIDYPGDFTLKIYTQPSLEFPVAGIGNRDAQSFWGASRDGGARSHEGVDIFAALGTPVVAAADGIVTRTGNQGLGGKQVWMRDGILGNSFYYAHLDSIVAESGTQVKLGDTLGFVGNTGNAKGGATHLHFGIYSSGGAVDAYPFIRKREVPKNVKAGFPNFSFLKADSVLRLGPGIKFEILHIIANETSSSILAGNEEWIHLITKDGKEGFVSRRRLK